MSFIEYFADFNRRRKCAKELRDLRKHYEPIIDKLKGLDRESEISSYIFECGPLNAELDYLDSKGLLKQARNLGIEVPRDWFDRNELFPFSFLTDMGKARLRKQVRSEQWKYRKHWIELITVLTGLIGTLIGLVALFKG